MSEERNTLVNSLRESFRRLDLQHRQREHADMEGSDGPDDLPKDKSAAREKYTSGEAAVSVRFGERLRSVEERGSVERQ